MRSTPSIYREQVSGVAHGESAGQADSHAHHDGPHAVSPLVLVGVFAMLMVLTVATVAVTEKDYGYTLNLIIALTIAVVKAVLVIAYFMHLRYDSPFYTFVVGLCLVFIAVFIIFTIIDTANYAPGLTPTVPAATG